MTGVLEWSEPAPLGHALATKWGPVVDELRANPGVWGLILREVGETECESSRTYLKRKYGMETKRRKVSDRTWNVWALCPEEDA